ncbi:MAG: HAMP domain-containing sensor histidine kinase [Chloroflexota bacterium]
MTKKLSVNQMLVVLMPISVGIVMSIMIQQNQLQMEDRIFEIHFDLAWFFSTVGLISTVIMIIWFNKKMMVSSKETHLNENRDQAYFEQNLEFLRRLDHELKNPLAIIRLGTSNLKAHERLNSSQQASLSRIEQQTVRLQSLIIDLRRLTDMKEEDLITTPIDLDDALREAIESTKGSYSTDRQINLSIQNIPWPVSDIQGDRELLILAFRNLIDNGLKYSEKTDQVDIRVSDNGQQVAIEIADNGMGIPSEELPYVFDNLYRGEHARGVKGSGLGLPMVKKIIHLHGGNLSVRSKDQKGTSFLMLFPISS